MALPSSLRKRFRRDRVKLQLDDIQGLILRSRPEPYVGIHAMLHVDDASGGRDLLGRLAEHVPSAEDWTNEMESWVGVAISHEGLKALGLPVKLHADQLSNLGGAALAARCGLRAPRRRAGAARQ